MPRARFLPPATHPKLSEEAQALSLARLAEEARQAEMLLGLTALPAVAAGVEEDPDAILAVVLQVNHQLALPSAALKSEKKGDQENVYATDALSGRPPTLDAAAAAIAAQLLSAAESPPEIVAPPVSYPAATRLVVRW